MTTKLRFKSTGIAAAVAAGLGVAAMATSCGQVEVGPIEGVGGEGGSAPRSEGGAGGMPPMFPPGVRHVGPLATGEIWSRAVGRTSNGGCRSPGVAAGRDGDVWWFGQFWGDVALDFKEPERSMTGPAVGSGMFLKRLSETGEELGEWRWSSPDGADVLAYSNIPWSVLVTPDGSQFVAGQFSGTMDFDPSDRADEAYSNSWDGFVLKLSRDGEFQWRKALGGTVSRLSSISIHDEIVLVAGQYSHKLAPEFDVPPTEVDEHGIGPMTQCILAALDASTGEVLWSQAWGNPDYPEFDCRMVVTDTNIVVATQFTYQLLLSEPDVALEAQGNALAVMGFDFSGVRQWVHQWTGPIDESARAISAYGERVYVGGPSRVVGGGKVTMSGVDGPVVLAQVGAAGTLDARLVQLAPADGAALWGQHWGVADGGRVSVDALASGPQGVIAAGGYKGVTSFLGTAAAPRESRPGFSGYLNYFDETGALVKTLFAGGPGQSTVISLAFASDSLFWAGDLNGEVDLDLSGDAPDVWTSGGVACFLARQKIK